MIRASVKRRVLNRTEERGVYEFIKTVTEPIEGGLVQYKIGWSDEAVYQHFLPIMPNVSPVSVRNIRADLVGKLPNNNPTGGHSKGGDTAHLEKMVQAHSQTLSNMAAEYERRFRQVEAQMVRLDVKLSTLIERLGGLADDAAEAH